MTVKEAAQLVSMAVAVMPNLQEKSLGAVVKSWAVIMCDVDANDAKAALVKLLRERSIPTLPLPGEILDTIRAMKPPKDEPPTALEAWDEVRRCLNPYAPTRWSHPLIGKAVQHTGIQSIIHGDWQVESRFMKIYDTLVKRSREKVTNPIILAIADKMSLSSVPQLSAENS